MFVSLKRAASLRLVVLRYLESGNVYGSSRLGIFSPEVKIQGVYVLDVAALKQSVRTYELTNHLGNVLSTITDKGVITSAQDYFPFGLTLASRSFTEGGSAYRYSFNGKEDDKETGLQDYGMRLHSKRLNRFWTVDPISKLYPELTPYQFASNRPVDGIDLDGLEYITIHVLYDYQHGSDVSAPKITITTQWHNEKQHNTHGLLGQGALYKFSVKDYSGKNYWQGSQFVSRNATEFKVPTEYGLYMGATGLFKIDSRPQQLGSFSKAPDYSIPPVDAVDNGAYVHDQDYDALGAAGKSGLLDDLGSTFADKKALDAWTNFLTSYPIGSTDPFSKQPVTSESRESAQGGAALFAGVVLKKYSNIESFIMKNYPSEYKATGSSISVFKDKYLEYNKKNDNYTRKKGMWNADNTPKTSSQ